MCRKGELTVRDSIETIIRETPWMRPVDIQGRLRGMRVHATKGYIQQVRNQMRRTMLLPNLQNRTRFPVLTAEEEQLLKEMQSFARRIVGWERRKRRISPEHEEDMQAYVDVRLPQWIRNFTSGGRTGIESYIRYKIKFAVTQTIRIRIKQEMGLVEKEARHIMQLLNGKRLGETVEQTAKRKEILLETAQELWELYQAYIHQQSFEQLAARQTI